MIRYTLECDNKHRFESWFQSADAFETVQTRGLVACPDCGDTRVKKTLMAPSVPKKGNAKPADSQPMTNAPDAELAKAMQALREHVEKTSDYVGDNFAREARAMHDGEKPHRAIYGSAKLEDAKKLVEDGVPAMPLPFIPRQKTN